MHRLIRNPIVVAVGFAVIFLLLLESRSSTADLAIELAIWLSFLSMSIVAVVRMLRHRAGPYGPRAILPTQFRRWFFDEPDEPRR